MQTLLAERTRPESARDGYPRNKNMRMADEDIERIRKLAEHWRCSESAAVRRAVQEATQREGIK